MRTLLTVVLALAGASGPLAGQVGTRLVPTAQPERYTRAIPGRLVPLTAPAPAVSVAASSASSISIEWPPVAGAGSHKVYHATANSGPWALAATVPGSVTRLDDQGLVPGTTFFYQVVSFSGPPGADTVRLASVLGSGSTAGVTAPVLQPPDCVIPPGTYGPTGPGYQTCTFTWQPLPLAVGYRVYLIAHPVQLGCSSYARHLVERLLTDARYHATDIRTRNWITCRYSYEFAAVYRMTDFPATGQVTDVEGPPAAWWP